MKRADWEKEEKFIEHYVMTGNATQSCIKAGYKKENSAQMGYYLKSKYAKEISEKQRDELMSMTGKSIDVLKHLLDNQSASVRFQSAKLVLELAGYKQENINLNIDKSSNELSNKSDSELMSDLSELIGDFPTQTVNEMILAIEKNKKKIKKH